MAATKMTTRKVCFLDRSIRRTVVTDEVQADLRRRCPWFSVTDLTSNGSHKAATVVLPEELAMLIGLSVQRRDGEWSQWFLRGEPISALEFSKINIWLHRSVVVGAWHNGIPFLFTKGLAEPLIDKHGNKRWDGFLMDDGTWFAPHTIEFALTQTP